ncbi:AAA family ATPase [Microbacterium xylanilyticum]
MSKKRDAAPAAAAPEESYATEAQRLGAHVWPPPGAPYETARLLVHRSLPWLEGYAFGEGSWWREGVTGEAEQVPADELRRGLYETLGLGVFRDREVAGDDEPGAFKQWNPTRSRVSDVEDALRSLLPRVPGDLPAVTSLRDLLEQDDDAEVAWRIEGLLAAGARALLAAPHKAGKSTIVGNLLRSLADGAAFLGRFEVRRAKRIVLVDDELDPRTLRAWLSDHGIDKAKRIEVVSLRGRVSSFDILTAEGRRRWAAHIGRCDVVVVDCIRPILDALGLDENRDGGRFTVALDELLALIGPEEGVSPECVAVHHTGHGGERSRGDSRFLDWPDATWRIAREDANDPASDRFFSAFGRDVAVPEGRLEFDPATRALVLGEGNRREGKLYRDMAAVAPGVVEFVASHPGASGAEIERGVDGSRDVVRLALKALWQDGTVVKEQRTGRGGGYGYRIGDLKPDEAAEFVTSRTSRNLAAANFPNLANLAYRASRGEVRFGDGAETVPGREVPAKAKKSKAFSEGGNRG